jgi:type 1 fimbriae regulatory protein FimE
MGQIFVGHTTPLFSASTRALHTRVGAEQAAGLPFGVHPHMPRHACGYKLANDGVDQCLCR